MIKNYIVIALRSLLRNPTHTIINVTGLSLGICTCLLMILFVKDEFTFDQFHSKADRIFRVYAIEDYGKDQRFFDTTTPFPMGPALKQNFQEVEEVVRINNITAQLTIDEKTFSEDITIAGPALLKIFDFKLVEGDSHTALSNQNDLLLTEDAATKFFGTSEAVGRTLSIQLADQFEVFTVKGVIENPPSNSSIQFSVVISDLNYPKLYDERLLNSAWFNVTPETYVLLRDHADASRLQKMFPAVFKTLLGDDYGRSKYFVGLQPLTSIHLDTSFPPAIAQVSDPKYAYILSTIAILILFVACINFITLSVGRSLKRAKEVGIRKVVGAMRTQLVFQFIGEAFLITIVSIFIGVLLAVLFLPVFNDLAGKRLTMSPDLFITSVIFSLAGIIGIFAGSYPAFILSGFKPISILKGNLRSGDNKQLTRKILVGTQLALSIFLISCTLFMNRQLNFLQAKNLGFDSEQVAVIQLNVPGNGRLSEKIRSGFEKAAVFETQLDKITGVVNACASSHDFGNGSWVNIGFTDNEGTYRTFNMNVVDADYIPSLKINLVAGRNFYADNLEDYKTSIIVNEAFVKAYGWQDPIGQRIPGKEFAEHQIIGVVRDFNYESLYTRVSPLVLAMDPAIPFSGLENINIGNSPIPKLLIRIRKGEITSTMAEIETIWKNVTGGEEFEFDFVDQRLAAQYRGDQNLGRIVSYGALLAIVIGSLGLYGLASLAMQNRVKEISIRKVMGATERSLLILLTREYVYMIVISLLISIPVTWYLMQNWLLEFEYRIPIGADVFLLAGLISVVVALATIGYQTLKTASTQPAKTLKYE
jgi:putative ABC transport system permease protein